MGEAKRRKLNHPTMVTLDAPEVRSMFDHAGRVFSIYMIGAAMVQWTLGSVASDTLVSDPAYRPWRLAFGTWDRIQRGEMRPWVCFLCQRPHSGLKELSCLGIIDQAPASKTNKAAILPVCHACDSVSTEETQRRLIAEFPLTAPLNEGTA